MYGVDILCGISKVPFEIPHNISYPYIKIWIFNSQVKMQVLLDLRAHQYFWSSLPELIMFAKTPTENPVVYRTYWLKCLYICVK